MLPAVLLLLLLSQDQLFRLLLTKMNNRSVSYRLSPDASILSPRSDSEVPPHLCLNEAGVHNAAIGSRPAPDNEVKDQLLS